MGSGKLSRRWAFLPRFSLPPVLPATDYRGRSLASLCSPLITESPAIPKQKQTTTVGQLFVSPVTHFTSSSRSLSRATEAPSTVAEGFLHLRIQSPSSRFSALSDPRSHRTRRRQHIGSPADVDADVDSTH